MLEMTLQSLALLVNIYTISVINKKHTEFKKEYQSLLKNYQLHIKN